MMVHAEIHSGISKRQSNLLSFFWLWLVVLLAVGNPLNCNAATNIDDLRTQQQTDLKNLESSYHDKVRSNPDLINPDGSVNTQHPEYQKILTDYSQEKAAIQSDYNDKDTRGADLESIQDRYGSKVKTTGSAPKDVRADVDISATDSNVARQIADDWKKQGDTVEYDPNLGIYINKTKDATLWQPPTPEQLSERQKYPDAFSTPGGKQATDVKGGESIRDPVGYVLDNEKKFIHSVEDLENTDIDSKDPNAQLKRDMALKTAGKSVSKSAQEVGHDSDTVEQANKLRNYGDKFEAGITPLGATPEQQKADERKWIGQADQEVQNAKPAAVQKSQKTRDIREALAKTAEKGAKGTADPNAENTAENIRERNRTLDQANEKALAANEEARKKAGLPTAPQPDEKEVQRQAENKAQRTADQAKDAKPSSDTTERTGSSKNSQWKITEGRDGDKRTKTHTSTTQNQDGSTTQRNTQTDTKKTAGGGKTTNVDRTVTQTGADGSNKQTRQQTSGYEGKKGSSSTTTTSETERDAGGKVTSQTDSKVTKNTRTGKSGSTTSTTEKSNSKQDYKGWMPKGTRGPTTTETSGHTIETDRGGNKTTTSTTTTKKTDDWGGRKVTTTTQTDSQSTKSTGEDGRETRTSVTTTTTNKPWQKSRTTEGFIERDHKPGGADDEPEKKPQSPVQTSVKIAGGKLFEPIDEAKHTTATSGAGSSGDGSDYGYDAKVQVGQYGATGTWEVTGDKDGLHAKAAVTGEVNVVKATANVSGERKVGDATLGGKVSTTAKVGAEGSGNVELTVAPDKLAVSTGAKVFVGGKAELAAEGSLSLWGLKLTGKAQGEVSAGAGAEAKLDAELSWTKIRLGGKLAATLGLGGGGSTSVELDATELITGHDVAALDRQFKAGDAIATVARGLRTGRLRLPPGVKFSDVRKILQEKADLYAKYPQTTKDGKPISLIDSLINELKLTKGKGSAYITAHHKQKDWYCTNRPQISSPVVLPSIVERK